MMKRFLAKLKKWAKGSVLRVVLIFLAVYAGLCYLYWYAEIGPGGSKTYLDILLWNNVNIVLGRGFTDLVPKTWKGRGLLMIFILFSMLFLSTIIGFISSKINANVNSPARRIKKVQQLSNHVIIFGWKNDIRALIGDILRKSPGLTAEDIVIVNNVPELKIQSLLMDKELKGIKYIRGDFTEEQTLMNANVKNASTALVLGEAHESLDAELVDCALAGGGELHSMNAEGRLQRVRAESGILALHEEYARGKGSAEQETGSGRSDGEAKP